MSWTMAVISVVYLSVAVVVPGPGDFVHCCVVGYLAMLNARNSWEDSQ